MTDNMNLSGSNGVGSESAMDLVLENFGIDDAELGDANYGDDGDDAFDSNIDVNGPIGDPQFQQQPPQQQQQQQQPQQRFQQSPQRGQQQQQQQQRPGLPPNAEVRADQRGNLIGPDGKIVAKAGFEARMYQETQRARRDLAGEQARSADLTSRLSRAIEIGQQLHTRVEGLQAQLNDRNTAASRLGLSDQESVQAMQLAANAKRDPVGTLKQILTMAAAAGIDVTKIGLAPGGVDARSLVDMVRGEINNAMNPLRQRMQTEQQQQQQQETERRVLRETESEVNQFFAQNPAALEHVPVFHAVLSDPRFQKMSLGEVWARIQLNQARMASDPSTQMRQNPQQRRNLPSGQGRPIPRGNGLDEMAPVNRSYDAILRETLDALGV